MSKKKGIDLSLQKDRCDSFALLSKRNGYRSRAAYKLLEIEERFKIINKSKLVVDLGAAPGSWTQVVMKKSPNAKIYSIDLLKIDPLGDNCKIVQCDFIEQFDSVKSLIDGKCDAVISDLAPSFTGHNCIDQQRSFELCNFVLDFCEQVLVSKGNAVMKFLMSNEYNNILRRSKLIFEQVKSFNCKATRKNSSEIFIILKSKKN